MTSLDYLSEAYRLDLRIDSKLGQIASLNELAEKCSSSITGMPHDPSHSVSSMADAVAKIVDLQTEIDGDIHRLIDIKRQIVAAIKAVDNKECQTLLELRFLCGHSWEEVAAKMGYSIQHTYRMRDLALKKIVPRANWRVNES
jgi:DNA-directed RNA polymerase specialized sigma subunit